MIGAGPAGLGCADVLVRGGVTPGGVRPQPGNRRPADLRHPRVQAGKNGAELRRESSPTWASSSASDTEVGRDVAFEQLLDEYDAVFMGMGTYTYMKGGFAGEDLPGVYDALDFLIGNVNRNWGCEASWHPYVDHRRQAGGGAGRRRHGDGLLPHRDPPGGASVTCAYRRDEANMPGSARGEERPGRGRAISSSTASRSRLSASIGSKA